MSDTQSEPHVVDIRTDDLHNHIASNESLVLELLDNETKPETNKPRKCVCVKDVKHKIINK